MYGYGYKYGKRIGEFTPSPGSALADAYKTRVEADSGTYENNGCLITFLNSLQ